MAKKDKFQPGDRVRCVKFSIENNANFIRLNDTGTVVRSTGHGEFGQTYLVAWDDPVENADTPDGSWWYCDEPDLEIAA